MKHSFVVRCLDESVRAERVKSAEHARAAFADEMFVDESSQCTIGGIGTETEQFEQALSVDFSPASAKHGRASDYPEFVIAVLVLPLAHLIVDD